MTEPIIPSWAERLDDDPLGAEAGDGGYARGVREPLSKMVLLLVPAGTYRRGAPDDEEGVHEREQPQHDVTISRPFYLGRFPVTQDQWRRVLGDDPSRRSLPENPVENVTFESILAFLDKTGLELPTEGQWEYACRAGTTGARYGDKLKRIAWYKDTSANLPREVGVRDPNAWGFHDMLGNVWEWCRDYYAADEYRRCAAGVVDPIGPEHGEERVLRGGSYSNTEIRCRAAYRFYLPERKHGPNTGFRCAGVAG